MTAGSDADASSTPAALSAFLRGVERRGAVLSHLQCGDAERAEHALAATLRAFRAQAERGPMAEWPRRFWRLLAATPALREPAAAPRWTPALQGLGRMSPGDRLAWLLRIVAGLDESAAAAVLEVSQDAYQQALARACPRNGAGQPDAQAWRALAEAAQQALRDLPPDRLEGLARPREAATAVPPARAPVAASAVHRSVARPRRRRPLRLRLPNAGRWRPWLVAGLLCVAALATLVLWRHGRYPALPPVPVSQAPAGALHVTEHAPVLVEELPAESTREQPGLANADPAETAMLADPELALARQADFYAWFAAGGPIPPDESEAQPAKQEMATAGLETLDDEP